MFSPHGTASENSWIKKRCGVLRDLVAFWFLGMCNNYGYVVMLSAAHDIIGQFEEKQAESTGKHTHNSTQRCCQTMSTGVILLADIVPLCICKAIVPFLPLWIHIWMLLTIALTVCSFILVAFAHAQWMAFLGVICTSASCGIGESTLLAYSYSFDKNVIYTWFSGTGGAGIFGAFLYAGLNQIGVSARSTMLIFLFVPATQALCFWFLLRKPRRIIANRIEYDAPPEVMTFKEKCAYTWNDLMQKYMAPLSLVYFAEYLINQGLYEHIYFEDAIINHPSQYRWYTAVYQMGVFLSRSSVNITDTNKLWPMAILQCLNVVLFTLDATLFLVPNIWIIFIMIFYEGLLGGSAYFNALRMISQEQPSEQRQFILGTVTQSDAYGIMSAGLLAIPVHNGICRGSVYPR